MTIEDHRAEYSATIAHVPGEGWCWSVYFNDKQYASEIEPELSRITAEEHVRKCLNALLGGGNDYD